MEKRNLIMIQTRVPQKTHKQLKTLAEKKGLTLNGIVNYAIEQYLTMQDLPYMMAKAENLLKLSAKANK